METVVQRTARPGRSRWPEFLVSARHEQVRLTPQGEQFVPYGPWHARRVGSGRSVCGRAATEWRFFWTLSFAQAGSQACPECVQALRERQLRRA